jgi:hypothetical protein
MLTLISHIDLGMDGGGYFDEEGVGQRARVAACHGDLTVEGWKQCG